MIDRLLPVALMLGAVGLWWLPSWVRAARTVQRDRARYRWDRHEEWARAMDALGGNDGR